MKLLFDQNISFRVLRTINASFRESTHVSNAKLLDASDSEIWNFAKDHHFVIVTFDMDFLSLLILRGSPPGLLLLKGGNRTTAKIAEAINSRSHEIQRLLTVQESSRTNCLELFI